MLVLSVKKTCARASSAFVCKGGGWRNHLLRHGNPEEVDLYLLKEKYLVISTFAFDYQNLIMRRNRACFGKSAFAVRGTFYLG